MAIKNAGLLYVSLFAFGGEISLKYLIADLVTEFSPKFDNLKKLCEAFIYNGNRSIDVNLSVSDEYIEKLHKKMTDESTIENAEEFAYSGVFNRAIIKHNAMLIHSSAICYNGGAYLFSARSGVGKSTHTKLWLKAFPDKVEIINDDKPVVRLVDNIPIVFGTPFDGGSGIANNKSAPLKAVVFLERGTENEIRKATSQEILNNLYFSTVRFINRVDADLLLKNIEKIMKSAEFYIMKCNMDISAAYISRDYII